MRYAKKYHEAMKDAFYPFREYVRLTEQILPALSNALGHARITANEEQRQALADLKKNLDQMERAIQKINNDLDAAGAATGHLQESQSGLTAIEHDLADLTTLAQYPEYAIRGSVEYNREILEAIELPIYEQALQEIELDRLLLIKAAVNRVVNQKRQ